MHAFDDRLSLPLGDLRIRRDPVTTYLHCYRVRNLDAAPRQRIVNCRPDLVTRLVLELVVLHPEPRLVPHRRIIELNQQHVGRRGLHDAGGL